MAEGAHRVAGINAVRTALKHGAGQASAVWVDASRHDRRLQEVVDAAKALGLRVQRVDRQTLDDLAGGANHQGVVAAVAVPAARDENGLYDLLEGLDHPPLLLVLDGVQDPHNLGACLRVADGAGAHAVIAPKDRSCGLTTAAIKVASGAAETVPYIVVTNLARTMRDLKERGIWMIGTADDAPQTLWQAKLDGALGLVLGAEGEGLRRLTRDTCDHLVSIPMLGSVESLNVSVASGVCLYEARRKRTVTP
jgi:23S rRNA (guanosine2251-2'-O)-methyltransferase